MGLLYYFKSFIRGFRANRAISLIILSGLVVGLASFLFLAVWVMNELSYDRFYEDSDLIYKVVEERVFPDKTIFSALTPGPLSEELKNYPEVESVARHAWTGERTVKAGDNLFTESLIITVDPEFIRLFNFKVLNGDDINPLEDINSVVLTRGTAVKYFGTENPIGKIITLDNKLDFKVTAVIEEIPSNSSIRFKMIVPFDVVAKLGWATDRWDFSMTSTYLKVRGNCDITALESKVAPVVKNHVNQSVTDLKLQPLTAVHLHSASDGGTGNFQYVLLFSIAAVLILLMAAFNYINLSIARAEYRIKEIGMRKVSGAGKVDLIVHYLVESLFMTLTALVCVPIFVFLFLPFFNTLTGETFTYLHFLNIKVLIVIFLTVLLIGIISGLYPALFLASLNPVEAIRRNKDTRAGRNIIRKVLVTAQIAVSIVLMVSFLIVSAQVDFFKTKDLGYDKSHVLSIPLGMGNAGNAGIFKSFRNAVEDYPGIENVSGSFTPISGFQAPSSEIKYKGRKLESSVPISMTSVEYNFVETLKMTLIEGRSFSRDFPSERGSVLVNETFARVMGTESPVGETIKIGPEYEGRIIGVLKDFHMESLKDSVISPLVIFQNPGINYIVLRLRPGDVEGTLAFLKSKWKSVAPLIPFKFNFLDEELNESYRDISSMGSVLKIFAALAAFIAAIGLFGITSFLISKRQSETGIRKLLGASLFSLVYNLSREYLALVVFAAGIGFPVAYYLMSRWLEDFAYRCDISILTFVFVLVVSLLIATLTVSFQTIKSAMRNPADVLNVE